MADISSLPPFVRYVGGMRMHLRGGARERIETAAPSRQPNPWRARWLELTTLIPAAAVVADAIVTGGITVTTGAHQLPLAAAGAIAVTTVISAAGTVFRARRGTA